MTDIVGIFSIVVYMAALIVSLTGLGLILQRLFGIRSMNMDLFFSAFWTGFAACICLLQIWHLFHAITWSALGIVALSGFAGLYLNFGRLLDWIRGMTRRRIALGFSCAVIAAAGVAGHAAGPPTAWDSAVYHITAVRWNTQYPVVIGLGNLHDRLAFNSSSLLYDAMLEVGPWAGRANHVANGLLVFMFLMQILRSAMRVRQATGGELAPDIFDLALLPPVIAIILSEDISSFTTDIPPAILVFVACSAMFRMLSARSSSPVQNNYNAVVVSCLATLAVCLKASYIFIGPLLIVLTFASLIFREPKEVPLRAAKWSIGIAVLLIAPWIAHGILLSGYPIYPSTFGGLPVDWRVPEELATATRLWVGTYHRYSLEGGLSWIPTWFTNEMRWYSFSRAPQFSRGNFGILIPLAITAVGAFGILIARSRLRIMNMGLSALVCVACAVAAVFWFWSAPGARFGFAILWSLSAASIAQLAYPWESQARRFALPAAFVLALVPIVFPLPRGQFVRTIFDRVVIRPGSDHGLYPYQVPNLYEYTTRSGLRLNVPVRDNRCFDSPLPCTPHPAPNLVLTQAWDGRPKFMTNGSWQQINWPSAADNPLMKSFLTRFKAQFQKE